jgi:hypothetical protein
MKFHMSAASGLKSGQSNRKRNFGNEVSYKLRGTDLARPSYRTRPRPRRRCPFIDFEDEDEDDDEDD